MTTTHRRPGVTLTEVLIATGIMAIGMTAILALFPIGAVNMARAINQDRTATHSMNEDNLFRIFWKATWTERDAFGVPTGTVYPHAEAAYEFPRSLQPMLPLLENHPNPAYGHLFGDPRWPDPSPVPTPAPVPVWRYPLQNTEPSYIVLVDPVGWQTKAGNPLEQGFIAGLRTLPVRTTLRNTHFEPPTPPVPAGQYVRIAPDPLADQATRANQTTFFENNYPTPFTSSTNRAAPVPAAPWGWTGSNQQIIRTTTLMDDMTFDAFGEPAAGTGQLERGGRYSVAWLIQRPSNAFANEVNIKVLAFSGRSPTDTPSQELAYGFTTPGAVPAQVANTSDQLTSNVILLSVPVGSQAPPIKRGGFIALSRTITRVSTVVPGGPPPRQFPTFDFHRVIGVNDDNAAAGILTVELESQLKVYHPGEYGQVLAGTAVVFDNLFEVYDRGTVSATGNVRP